MINNALIDVKTIEKCFWSCIFVLFKILKWSFRVYGKSLIAKRKNGLLKSTAGCFRRRDLKRVCVNNSYQYFYLETESLMNAN